MKYGYMGWLIWWGIGGVLLSTGGCGGGLDGFYKKHGKTDIYSTTAPDAQIHAPIRRCTYERERCSISHQICHPTSTLGPL